MSAVENIQGAEVEVPCVDFAETLDFFTNELGFRINIIFPADNPATSMISGYGLSVKLQRYDEMPENPGVLRLLSSDPKYISDGESELVAPNGTRIQFAPLEPPLVIPPVDQSLVIAKVGNDAAWGTGRAGMQYRDLIPGRQGGRFIASHIRIPTGGPVLDYEHFHKVRFQMIYCYKGWVRLVYEDQGEPFIMKAGGCVIQPPEIRHRVLESGDGLEVIEIGCPAEHPTFVDHEMPLPNGPANPDRVFKDGQRFIHHIAEEAVWKPWRLDGFEARDIGIEEVTDGLAGVKVARVAGDVPVRLVRHDAEFLFMFVQQGQVTVEIEGQKSERLSTADAITIPEGLGHTLTDCSDDLEILEVALPAVFAMG